MMGRQVRSTIFWIRQCEIPSSCLTVTNLQHLQMPSLDLHKNGLAMGGGGTQKTLPLTVELFIIDRLMKTKHHCL